MECQAPPRLKENGKDNYDYIDFMEKMPENRKSMTDDEIYDWLISRRGGTREEIKKCFGEDHFPEWITWLTYSDEDKYDENVRCPLYKLELHFKSTDAILEYVNATGDDQGWENREKFEKFFRERNWLGFGSEEAVFQDIYNAIIQQRLNYFRYKEDKRVCDSIEFIYVTCTGHGLDKEDWDKLQLWDKDRNVDVNPKWIWHIYLIGGHHHY